MKAPEAAAGPYIARAKVNLYLHVTGRRADGYHELDSLFVRTGLADRLWLAPAAEDRLVVSGPFAAALAGEAAESNLALRAVDAVRRRLGARGGVAVTLEKNIPVAAGLGGGSADAATALRAACRFFGGDPQGVDLPSLAAALGADVPPCLDETPLAVSGIGERLAPAPALPPCALVLVNPGVALATARVFAAFDGRLSPPAPLDSAPVDLAALASALARRGNDLERTAVALVPQVGAALALLAGLPGVALARMSGSGATCFALVADGATARDVAARVVAAQPSWWTVATGLVAR